MTRDPNMPSICCFTGHRVLPRERLGELSELMDRALSSMIHQGVRDFRTGGALGFDTLAALKVLDLRERYGDVRLHLYLPCRDQDERWSERDRQIYRGILERADDALCLHEAYTRGCMLARNRAMVKDSAYCIAFCTEERGGTAYTVRYAKAQGVPVINLADYLCLS